MIWCMQTQGSHSHIYFCLDSLGKKNMTDIYFIFLYKISKRYVKVVLRLMHMHASIELRVK